MPTKWALKRPEELRPEEFIDLTAELYGEKPTPKRSYNPILTREALTTNRVWRHPSKNFNYESLEKDDKNNENNNKNNDNEEVDENDDEETIDEGNQFTQNKLQMKIFDSVELKGDLDRKV